MAFAPDYALQRPLLRLLHRRRRRPARRRVPALERATAPTPARRGSCSAWPTRESNHNGGLLLFGPDDHLYIGTGDGGGGGRPARQPRQRPEPRLAARQDPAHRPDARPAAGPTGPERQPVRGPQRRARRDLRLRPAQPVAVLVRPPQRRPLDRRRRPERGRGDRLRAAAGAAQNFGWRPFEGRSRYDVRRVRPGRGPARASSASTAGGNCSITGGVVVRDRALRGLYGRYVFGDFCRGRIESAKLSPGRARVGAQHVDDRSTACRRSARTRAAGCTRSR